MKIGYTRDHGSLKRRLASLQTGQPWRLEVLRVIEGGGQWMESWFHSVFSAAHSHWEWFTYTPAMLEIEPDIETICRRMPRMQAREALEAMVDRLVDILDGWTPDPETEPEADDEPDAVADEEMEVDDEPDYAADEEVDVDAELSEVEVGA